MEIGRIRLLGSVNIGLYAKASNSILLYHADILRRKVDQLVSDLKVRPVPIKPLNTRVISPFVAMNSRGLVISRHVDADLKENIVKAIGGLDLKLVELDVKHTAIGNLIAMNDRAALVSPILPSRVRRIIADELDVEVSSMTIGRASYVGSLLAVNNHGGLVAPIVKDDELDFIRSLFRVDVYTGTVNNGDPFVSAGMILNDNAIYVGENTIGRELMVISQAFGG